MWLLLVLPGPARIAGTSYGAAVIDANQTTVRLRPEPKDLPAKPPQQDVDASRRLLRGALPSRVAAPNALAPAAEGQDAEAPRGTRLSTNAAKRILATRSPWVAGTWTTGYWDCCKPSCAWPGKGNVDQPVAACDAKTGQRLRNFSEASVCTNGTAASCIANQPFVVRPGLAMGFAAAAVSGLSGLTGDENCGQCYELKFVDRMHNDTDVWGGAHRDLVDKSLVVQITNIGHDVSGKHSFDIQIPSAGQGLFTGCTRQFTGFRTDDFDCGQRYGGCEAIEGCLLLPPELQPGCYWRFDWYMWFKEQGKTNNPWVQFRRVRCPKELIAISESTPLDDHLFQGINYDDYR